MIRRLLFTIAALTLSAVTLVSAQTPQLPATPNFTKPVNGQVNVSPNTEIEWSNSAITDTANPNFTGNITYRLSIGTEMNCATHSVRRNDLSGTSYRLSEINQALSLGLDTVFFFCIEAFGPTNLVSTTRRIMIRTRKADVAKPSISIFPSTSEGMPSGNPVFQVQGENGEEGSRAILYLQLPDRAVEVASTTIGDEQLGRFSMTVSALDIPVTETKRTYFVRIARPVDGDEQFSLPSETASYFFDENFKLATPIVERLSPTSPSFRWLPISGATTYDIYRRVDQEICTNPATQNCYLGNKPYKRILNPTIVAAGEFLAFSENIAIPSSKGASYFVVARNNIGQISSRSNTADFSDTTTADLDLSTALNYISPKSGDRVQIYLCEGINRQAQFLDTDNSADQIVEVQWTPKSGNANCAGTDFSSADSGEFLFDALQTTTVSEFGIQNCSLGAEVPGLAPETLYCFNVCLKDKDNASNPGNCSIDEQRTLKDSVAPEFNGISNLVTLESGNELMAQWEASTEDGKAFDLITYLVKATDQFDEDGEPLFDEVKAIAVSNSKTSATIGSLVDDGRSYAVKVTAVDKSGNENESNNYLVATTRDNYPRIIDIRLRHAEDQRSGRYMEIDLFVFDRRDPNVSLSSISVRRQDEDDFAEVLPDHLSLKAIGNSRAALSGNSIEAGNSISNLPVTTVLFNTLPYYDSEESVELKLCVQNADGRESCANSATTVNTSLSGSSFKARSDLGSCSMDANSNGYALLFIIFGLLGVRQIRRQVSFRILKVSKFLKNS